MSKVWKSTGFALIAALLLCTAPDWSGAQNADPNEPIKLEDGKLRFAGAAHDVTLESLIGHYVEATGRVLVFDARKIRNAKVEFVAPAKGKTVNPEDALRVALLQFRLVLVKHGKFDEIVSTVEASAFAESVTEAELSTRNPHEYIRFVYHLAYANAQMMRGMIQSLTSRQGGQVMPLTQRPGPASDVDISALVICDEAGNVRDLVKLIKMLDKPRKTAKPSDD